MRNFNSPILMFFVPAFIVFLVNACSDSAQSQSGEYEVIQLIGDYNNATIEAVRSNLTVVPFSPDYNPQVTPIMIAPGLLEPADGLTEQEKDAIKASYDAGQTLAIISPSTIDVEALHGLLDAGAAYTSTTHPIHMAYIIRSEESNPVSRVLQNIRATPGKAQDTGADERAYARAYNILVEDLSRAPLPSNESVSVLSGASVDLSATSLQTTFLTSTTSGTYNTTVKFFAAHACESNQANPQPYDFYVVTSSGDWTPSEARWQSASAREGELFLANGSTNYADGLEVEWQDTDDYCDGGEAIAQDIPFSKYDLRLCRYMNYPKQYSVSFLPPAGIKTDQVNAQPSATPGTATSYATGFNFTLGGGVNVSGKGAGAGLQAGVTWTEKTTNSVPSLLVKAGISGNEGRYTDYVYCTSGTQPESCISTIQMTGSGICVNYDVGDPQDGQESSGSMSNVQQSVRLVVGENGTYPGVYGGATHYPITVNWSVELATSTSRLWPGAFSLPPSEATGPTGMCNLSGCSCSIETTTNPITASYTFKVPLPSSDCSPPTPPPPAPSSDCSAAFCAANPGASCTATPSCEYCDKSECHE